MTRARLFPVESADGSAIRPLFCALQLAHAAAEAARLRLGPGTSATAAAVIEDAEATLAALAQRLAQAGGGGAAAQRGIPPGAVASAAPSDFAYRQ